MANCSWAPNRWFIISQADMLSCWPNSWPWTKLTYADITNIFGSRYTDGVNAMAQLLAMIICPFGIVGSLCSIASVWRKSIKDKEVFFQWMLVIACLDFLYCCFCFYAYIGGDQLFKTPYSYHGTVVMDYFWGIIYSLSLASSLCTLGLTLERFFGICKPTTHYLKKSFQKFIGVSAIVFLSLIKLKGSFIYAPVISGGTADNPKFSVTYTAFYKTLSCQILTYIGDFLLPILLLLCMSYFSLRIAVTIVVRRKKKIHDPSFGGAQQQAEATKRMSAMLRLLVILVSLFTLNQVGYCCVTIGVLPKIWSDNLSFNSTYDELSSQFSWEKYRRISYVLIATLEALASSLNFYLYFCFSSTIREEFKLFLRQYFKVGQAASLAQVLSHPLSNNSAVANQKGQNHS